MNVRTIFSILVASAFTGLVPVLAQEISVPDPGLNAAIHAALQKSTGPLTEADLLNLTNLNAGGLSISNVTGLEAANNLRILGLENNALTDFPIAGSLTNLTILDLFGNHLTNFSLTTASSKFTILDVAFNSLDECSLPGGLTNLNTLFLEGNVLTNLNLPSGLSQLAQLDLSDNQLTNVTIPPDVTKLTGLFLADNPLITLVLSEPLVTNLTSTITNLQNQGVQVFTYPLATRLTLPQQQPIETFRFGITGPPGVYVVYSSSNLTIWDPSGFANNPLGSVLFVDTEAHLAPQKFYRALLLSPVTDPFTLQH